MKPNEMTASEAARKIAAGELTARALTESCLRRIEEREPEVMAWEHIDAEGALRQAAELDKGPIRGPLHGLPVGIKDIMETADMPTTYGSPIYAGHRAAADASVVALIRAAGGIILGKTVTTEFATYHPGKTRNPRNLGHTPGGSSSGSAAAVADGMIPLATGTQTAGSMIRPAAFCGVVGYKPTFGMINRAGVKPAADSLDTIGLFGRAVEDVALMASAITRRQLVPGPNATLKRPKIGFCKTYEWPSADAATIAALDQARERLAATGNPADEVELPKPFATLAQAQTDIFSFEAADAFAYEWNAQRDQINAELVELIEAGLNCSSTRYDEAKAEVRHCLALLDEAFGGHDALLVPSVIGEAPGSLETTGSPLFCRIWTALGTPAVNLPIFTGPNGLPVGIQLVARPNADALLLASAQWTMEQLKDGM